MLSEIQQRIKGSVSWRSWQSRFPTFRGGGARGSGPGRVAGLGKPNQCSCELAVGNVQFLPQAQPYIVKAASCRESFLNFGPSRTDDRRFYNAWSGRIAHTAKSNILLRRYHEISTLTREKKSRDVPNLVLVLILDH
jgi:hypothetical protein